MAFVGISRPAVWTVRSNVSLVRTPSWHVRTLVPFTRQARFDVASILAKIAISRSTSWNLLALQRFTRQAKWQVGAQHGTSGATDFIARQSAFDRVQVNYLTIGTATITWALSPHFLEPLPHTFQLQAGFTGHVDADDWIDVGAPVVNTFIQTDNTRRWYGKMQTPHYRLKLTTGFGRVYYSFTANILGDLGWKDWRIAQEILRKEKLRHKHFTSVDGFLLKQKRGGPKCYRCLDVPTDQPTDSKCPICFGTRWVGGYFKALPVFFADVTNEQFREHRNLQGPGMEKSLVVYGRFLGIPQVYAQDIWVNKTADARYQIHSIKVDAQIRGVPIVVTAELRKLPPGDVAYLLPLS